MPTLISVRASIDKMPGAGNPLHVRAEFNVPTGGWSGTLKKANPQGTNELVLILEAELHKPTGTVTQGFTDITVPFDEQPAAREYTHVEVRFGGESMIATVAITH